MKKQVPTSFYFVVLALLIFEPVNAQTFTRIETGPHVNDSEDSEACAWGDFDNDGDEDLFVANGLTSGKKNFLFINEGSENEYSFILLEEGAIVNDVSCSRESSWGDYDNDGYLDLFVANQISNLYNYLYRNNGDNTFTRYTQGAMAYDYVDSEVGGWVDYDNDGYLDILVNNFDKPSGLYHGNRDGSFTAILEGPLYSNGLQDGAWADFDNDGDPDYLGKVLPEELHALFINEGNGVFSKVQEGMVLGDPTDPMSGDNWVDYDNDGDWDFVSAGNKIYRNEGKEYDYKFKLITSPDSIIDEYGLPQWADMDNDGDIDCFVEYYWGHDNLFSNNGDGTFTKITEGDIVLGETPTTGSAWADYDNDGDMDLYACNTNGVNNILFRNDNDNGNSWLKVKLKGTASNAAAIGAVVKVKANTGSGDVWQMRAIEGQSGFLGQNSLVAHFGLGTATVVDSLLIQWPAGHDTVITNVDTNQLVTVSEIIPNGYLKTNFLADTVVGYEMLTVEFTDESKYPTGSAISWSWDFDEDGIEDSNVPNPSHTFYASENEFHSVRLITSNGTTSDTLERIDMIRVVPTTGNLALVGKATASSAPDLLFSASKAIDGTTYAAWKPEKTDNEWLKIELHEESNIGKVAINWGSTFGEQYSIQTSNDDINWETVYLMCGGNGENDTLYFTGIDTRFLKLQGIKRNSSQAYIIKELEVFLSDGNTYPAITNECPNAIEDKSSKGIAVNVCPNPVKNQLTINLYESSASSTRIEIIDISGKIFYSTCLPAGIMQTTINIPEFSPGIYLLRISNSNTTVVKKINKINSF